MGLNRAQIVLLPEKEIFWENWLISPPNLPQYAAMSQKKILTLEQIIRWKVSKFWAKLGPNCPFLLKDVSWLLLKFHLLHVLYHNTTISQNIRMQNFWRKLPKGLLGKLTIVTFVCLFFYSILLYYLCHTKKFKLKKDL